MTKGTLGSSEAFPTHPPSPGVHHLSSTSHATPGLAPIFAMETTHDLNCTTHMHRLLQHQILVNLSMEPPRWFQARQYEGPRSCEAGGAELGIF